MPLFEKRRIERFIRKSVLNKDGQIITSNYEKAKDFIKQSPEVCSAIIKQDKSLLSILPHTAQIEHLTQVLEAQNDPEQILKVGNPQSHFERASKEVISEFFQTNRFNDEVVSFYLTEYPEVISSYVENNPAFVFEINKNNLYRALDVLHNSNISQTIVSNQDIMTRPDILSSLLSKDDSLFGLLSTEDKLSYLSSIKNVETFNSLLSHLNEEEQVKSVSQIISSFNKEQVFTLNNEHAKKAVASQDTKYMHKCSSEQQQEFLKVDKNLVKWLSEEAKEEAVKQDIKLFDVLIRGEHIVNAKYHNTSKETLNNLLKSIDYSQINTEDILSSDFFSAKGTLFNTHSANGDYEMFFGTHQYTSGQLEFFKDMPKEQMIELCNNDVNYILPYATANTPEEIPETISKIKEIFGSMFGEEKLEEFTPAIEAIFSNYNCDHSENTHCPLDSLKLLFNKDIITSNDPKLITDYITSSVTDTPNSDLFKDIVKNTYGEEAGKILESRPNLNEHTINSLEVFSPALLEKFGTGCIHDLISYNFSGMSNLIAISKNEEKLETLSEIFQFNSSLYGQTASTFQQALTDFSKMEPLFKDISQSELSPQEQHSLQCVLLNHNFGEITTKEELANYESIVQSKLTSQITSITDPNYIKERTCEALFGTNYLSTYTRNPHTLYSLLKTYTQTNAHESNFFTENEKSIMDFVGLVANEQNPEVLTSIITEAFEQGNTLGNLDFITATNNMIKNQENLLNSNLVTIEKLENEIAKGSELVTKTILHGTPVYVLNGIDFSVLTHLTGGTNSEEIQKEMLDTSTSTLEKFKTLEEQFGSGTISTWFRTNNTVKAVEDNNMTFTQNNYLNLGFSQVPSGSLVGMDFQPGGISTDHAPKMHSAMAKNGGISYYNIQDSTTASEVSFSRRITDQAEIENENNGGRITPDYLYCELPLEDMSKITEIKLYSPDLEPFDQNIPTEERLPIIIANTLAYAKENTMLETQQADNVQDQTN